MFSVKKNWQLQLQVSNICHINNMFRTRSLSLGDAFLNHLCYADDICLISLSSDNVVRYYIVYSMYGFVTFVCIFIFVDLCYNENNSFLKIILFSYL